MVLDAWEYPYNGTVVSGHRFVDAMQRDFDFTVLATPAPASNTRQLVPFSKLSIPGFNGLIDAMRVPLSVPNKSRLREALAAVDLVHIQFPFFLGFTAISIAKELGIPVVASFHVQPENILRNIGLDYGFLNTALYRLFIAAIYERTDAVVAPSRFAADLLAQHGLSRPAEVISNGVLPSFLAVCRQPGHAPGMNILSVGRLAAEKQQHILIDAVARSQHRDQIVLNIVGTGPLEAQLRAQIAQTGINGTVATVSNAELMAHYARADLFVHTGEIELEGMSVTEAMATGNMVLVSDSPMSAARTLVNQDNATFRRGDASHLAGLIDFWLSHADQRVSEGENNRQQVRDLAHADSCEQMAALYQRLMSLPRLARQ